MFETLGSIVAAFGSAADAIGPHAGDLVSLAVTLVIAYLSRSLKTRLDIDIDARHREVLHSAAMSALHAAGLTEWAMANPGARSIPPETLKDARRRAFANGGDAIRHFIPDAVAEVSPLPDALDHLIMRKGMEILSDFRR